MSGRPLHAVALTAVPQLLDALAAALDGGPALLPVDPGLPAPARDALLAALRPAAIINAAGTRPLPDGVPVSDDVAVVVATSGSTGDPKGVELTAAALRHSAHATLARVGAHAGDRWLCCLPPSGIAGLQVLVRSLVAGTEPVVLDRFSVDAVRAAPAQHVALVPTMLQRLLDAGADLTGFSTVLVGGAALPQSMRNRAAGARIITTYGMTETAGGCVYDGVPLDGVSLDLADDGRIGIGGPVLASGYRLRPDLTEAAFVGGRLSTADLGQFDAAGRLEVLGRVDDVMVTGGVNVSATAVADLLSKHPGVAQVAVVPADDSEWGQRVVAIVVPDPAGEPPTLAELRAHVRAHAPAAHAPRELRLVNALPVLASGKLDRRTLRGMPR